MAPYGIRICRKRNAPTIVLSAPAPARPIGAKEGIMRHPAACILLSLVSVGGISRADDPPSIQSPAEETYQASVAADGTQHVSITGGNYFFRPKHVIVRINVPVEFGVILEKGIVPHTLVIQAPEAGIAVDEKLGTEVKKIRFTPTAVGKYSFYCKNKLLFLKSHKEKGMEGMLEVVE